MPTDDGDLDGLRFCLGGGASLETLSELSLLFSPGEQQIHRLNDSSAVLAERLQAAATLKELTRELAVRGVDQRLCSEWVMSFLRSLCHLGVLAAEPPTDTLNTQLRQNISVAGLTIALVYTCQEAFKLIAPAYAHLSTDDLNVRCTYRLSAVGEFVLIGKDSARPLVFERAYAGVQLKGIILEEVLRAADHLFALHAACLVGHDGAVLLLGSPGAGKSTLCLALMRRGYDYSADDVTLVGEKGQVRGVALAPAVKDGAWELLRNADPHLPELPVHLRTDGQTVRFLPMSDHPSALPGRVTLVVKLCRSAGEKTIVERMSSADAIAELLREAKSPDGSCSAEIFHAVADLVRGARCVELRYAEATDGASAIWDYHHA